MTANHGRSRHSRTPSYRLLVGFATMGAWLLFLVSCSGNDSDSSPVATPTPTAEQLSDAFCSDLDDVKSDLNGIVSSVKTLDRNQIEQSVKDAQGSITELKNSGQQLRSSEAPSISTAYDDLMSSITAIGQGGGLLANLGAVQSSVTGLVLAVSDAVSAHDCKQ